MQSAFQTLGISLSSVVVAVISTYAILKGQIRQERQSRNQNNTVQIQTIFDGYSRIVADLHAEVGRLRNVVDELHREQEICEARNEALEKEITGLLERICRLEEASGG